MVSWGAVGHGSASNTATHCSAHWTPSLGLMDALGPMATRLPAGFASGFHYDVERRLQQLEEARNTLLSEVQHVRRWALCTERASRKRTRDGMTGAPCTCSHGSEWCTARTPASVVQPRLACRMCGAAAHVPRYLQVPWQCGRTTLLTPTTTCGGPY